MTEKISLKVFNIKTVLKLFKNCRLVNPDFKGYQAKMAFIVESGILTWMGTQAKIPKTLKFQSVTDLKNNLVLPSFIECHTHTVFAGSRADEFELRNNGTSYLEIAAAGGGIKSTMAKTRAASLKQLAETAQKRVNQFLKQGVSTLEIKSGYGLDLKNELTKLNK